MSQNELIYVQIFKVVSFWGLHFGPLLKFLDSLLLLIQCSVIKFIYIQNS